VVDALRRRFGDFFLLPEGGSNAAAVRGAAELPAELAIPYDVICCALIPGRQPERGLHRASPPSHRQLARGSTVRLRTLPTGHSEETATALTPTAGCGYPKIVCDTGRNAKQRQPERFRQSVETATRSVVAGRGGSERRRTAL